MTARFVTIAEARAVSGLSVDIISDDDMDEFITDIEYQMEKFLNADFTPHIQIDSLDGNNKPTIFTNRAPLLTVRKLQINDADINIANIDFKKSGIIRLLNNATKATFTRLRKSIFIKYVHGRVQWDKETETESTSDIDIGTSVAIPVSSETGFTTGDWIEISSFDGNIEHSKITSTATSSITVDELVFDHESGAIIRLMQLDPTIKRLIKVWVGIATVTRAVGQSFDDITGYTLGEFQVQKGEPFTQFRETIVRLESQAKDLMSKLRPTPGILV